MIITEAQQQLIDQMTAYQLNGATAAEWRALAHAFDDIAWYSHAITCGMNAQAAEGERKVEVENG